MSMTIGKKPTNILFTVTKRKGKESLGIITSDLHTLSLRLVGQIWFGRKLSSMLLSEHLVDV